MPAGLITRDAAGNILLDTTTAMFRMLGFLHIRMAWTSGSTWNDKTGSHTDPGLLLGTPFFFCRPVAFRQIDPLYNGYLSMSVSGVVLSWEWFAAAPTASNERYYDIAYGVRS